MIGHNAGFVATAKEETYQVVLTRTDVSPWTVPANWNPNDNKIEAIGAGGGGGSWGRGAGGGGEYCRVENVNITGAQTFVIGVGGSGGYGNVVGNYIGANGTNTSFGNIGGVHVVRAVGGKGATQGSSDTVGGAGGTGGIGTFKYAGGKGGNGTGHGGPGGGGAGGPNGAGANGGQLAVVNPVYFEGESTYDFYVTLGADGSVDGKISTFSFWYRWQSDRVTNPAIFSIGSALGDYFSIRVMSATGYVRVTGGTSYENNPITMYSNVSIRDGQWHHVLITFDTSIGNNASFIYIDDVDVKASNATFYDAQLGFTAQKHWNEFSNNRSAAYMNMAQFWWSNTWLDITNVSNRRYFITDAGCPAPWQSNGQHVTGSSPWYYLPNTNFITNHGTLIDLTEQSSSSAGASSNTPANPWGGAGGGGSDGGSWGRSNGKVSPGANGGANSSGGGFGIGSTQGGNWGTGGIYGGGGGGGGGTRTSGATADPGFPGGSTTSWANLEIGSGAGGGGGGGANTSSGYGGHGGKGGDYGGGGGTGGVGGPSGSNNGEGGNGGDGVVVITWKSTVPTTLEYRPNAVHFSANDVGDYFYSANPPTGVVDGKQGTLSFWIKHLGDNWDDPSIISAPTTSNTLQVCIESSNGCVKIECGTFFQLISNTTIWQNPSSNNNWHHILATWDLSVGTSACMLYHNDASDKLGGGLYGNFNIDYTTQWQFNDFNTQRSGQGMYSIADFWFNPTYLDISNVTNRRKFINANRKPVNLGAAGQAPLGSQPLWYFGNGPASWGTNLGSGGNVTAQENTALIWASTNPAD